MSGHIWTKFLDAIETAIHFIAYLTSWGDGFAGSENKFQKMEDKFFEPLPRRLASSHRPTPDKMPDSKRTEDNDT